MIFFSLLLAALFGLYCYSDYKKGLALIPALSPLYLIRFSVGPIPTTLLEVLIVVSLLFFLVQRPKIQLSRGLIGLGALLFAVLCVGVLAAPDTLSALGIARAYYIVPFFYFIAASYSLSVSDFLFGLRALAVTVVLLTTYGIFQFLTGLGLPIPYDFSRRITSAFPYPNAFGLFVTPVLSALFALGLFTKRHLLSVAAALSAFALFLSETEAGLVAFTAVAFLAVFLHMSRMRSRVLLGAAGLLVLAVALFVPFTREKLLLQDYSGGVRQAQWSDTATYLQDHFLFGAGFDGYPSAIAGYHSNPDIEIFQYPHNFILNAWVEAGILNVALVLILLSLVLWQLPISRRSIAIVPLIALLAMFIHGLVDVPFYKNDLAILAAFFFAFLFSLSSLDKAA